MTKLTEGTTYQGEAELCDVLDQITEADTIRAEFMPTSAGNRVAVESAPHVDGKQVRVFGTKLRSYGGWITRNLTAITILKLATREPEPPAWNGAQVALTNDSDSGIVPWSLADNGEYTSRLSSFTASVTAAELVVGWDTIIPIIDANGLTTVEAGQRLSREAAEQVADMIYEYRSDNYGSSFRDATIHALTGGES